MLPFSRKLCCHLHKFVQECCLLACSPKLTQVLSFKTKNILSHNGMWQLTSIINKINVPQTFLRTIRSRHFSQWTILEWRRYCESKEEEVHLQHCHGAAAAASDPVQSWTSRGLHRNQRFRGASSSESFRIRFAGNVKALIQQMFSRDGVILTHNIPSG